MDVLPRLPSDIIRAAFPDEPQPEWLRRLSRRHGSLEKGERTAIATAMRFLKEADPRYYNSVVERHTRSFRAKPEALNTIPKGGFLADDGTVYVNKRVKMDAKIAQRMIETTEAKIIELEAKEKERLERLKKAIRSGDVIFTDGKIRYVEKEAAHAQTEVSNRCTLSELKRFFPKVPWRVGQATSLPSKSSASRLPSIVKPRGGTADPQAAVPKPAPKPQKNVVGPSSGVASLDPVQRAKLKDMLDQEEEALRKMIELELQLARKAEL